MKPLTFEEYFYKKLCDVEEKEAELIRQIRLKRGILPLCLQLWRVEIERATLTNLYIELKQLF